ncbi:MAG: MoxR family ATPase [Clostridiales bacterium]|nr:MoxR family ATPase [Clostridiales bacterium]
MTIKEAKQEIMNTVQAYLAKDSLGNFRIPVEHQRPVLLIGPPGIGKTAIMEQVARECGINLVSYTMTHHTRQSAIGLPFIEKRNYGGEEVSVTEYTMSEIIASIYDQIEKSGIKEGILFLDEINCVSETLAPMMLQFLQYKTFGSHRVPEGFVIVAAGNPPEYNKSVRDFDIVTYDRVKRIYVKEDYPAWKEYAYSAKIHGAVLSYLEIKKKNFYSVISDVEGKRFVTARGWEDLSVAMKTYEGLGIAVTFDFIVQYVQDAEIARDFATYYELYGRYRDVYKIPEILEGDFPEEQQEGKVTPFDEKLSLIGLLVDRLNEDFAGYAVGRLAQQDFLVQLTALRKKLLAGEGTALELLGKIADEYAQETKKKKSVGLLEPDEERARYAAGELMKKAQGLLASKGSGRAREDFALLKSYFDERERSRQRAVKSAENHLTNAFLFLSKTFGEGQEIVMFLSELSSDGYALKFVGECGNEEYYRYNKLLLLKDRGQELRQEVLELRGISV